MQHTLDKMRIDLDEKKGQIASCSNVQERHGIEGEFDDEKEACIELILSDPFGLPYSHGVDIYD
jgi:hypothetical protein